MARQAAIPLGCSCGRVQGELGTRGTYTRATCYCNDCRAYARWLGVPGLLDEAGGVDVVAMAPSRVRLTAGADQVACMSWSERDAAFGQPRRCLVSTTSAEIVRR